LNCQTRATIRVFHGFVSATPKTSVLESYRTKDFYSRMGTYRIYFNFTSFLWTGLLYCRVVHNSSASWFVRKITNPDCRVFLAKQILTCLVKKLAAIMGP